MKIPLSVDWPRQLVMLIMQSEQIEVSYSATNFITKRDIFDRAKGTHPVSNNATRRVASLCDYWISITIEPIKFWVGSIDSLGSNYIIKVFLFFLYVPYVRRYYDAKFESRIFTLRYVVLVIAQILGSVCNFWREEALICMSERESKVRVRE